jgi:hypothetical protein
MKNITITVLTPFFSKKIESNDTNPAEFHFNKTHFEYWGNKTDNSGQMSLIIRWNIESYNNEKIGSYIEKGIEALNHVIYYARTFDDDSTNMVLISPRTVKTVHVVITESEKEILNADQDLAYTPPRYFHEYYDYINDGSWNADFNEIIELAGNQILEINLLVDANHAIFEGRYSEAIINCLTAIETHIFPILSEWLKNSFLNKSEKNAENLLIDLTSGSKLELLFGTVKSEYLKHHPKLLEDLKGINRLRNNIVHKGTRASKAEATNALNMTAKFIMILYFQIGENDYNWSE